MENTNIKSYLKRITLFLEDGSWEEADVYCEKVLDIEPECAEAYLGKLLAEFKVHSIDELSQVDIKLDESKHYKKILRYADDKLCEEITEIAKTISKKAALKAEEKKAESLYNNACACENSNDENVILDCIQKLESISDYKDSDEKAELFKQRYNQIMYSKGIKKMNSAVVKSDFEQAAEYFRKIEDYKDSALKIQECLDSDFEIIYRNAVKLQDSALNEADYNNVIKEFDKLGTYKDSYERSKKCQERIHELYFLASAQKRKKKRKITAIVICSIIAVIITAALIYFFGFIKPKMDTYNEACRLYNEAESITVSNDLAESYFNEGYSLREEYIKLYKQSEYDEAETKFDECVVKFNTAKASYNTNENKSNEAAEKYEQAEKLFCELGDYKDSKEKQGYAAERKKESVYDKALAISNQGSCLFNIGEFDQACEKYEAAKNNWSALGDYWDSDLFVKYMEAHIAKCNDDDETAKSLFKELGDFQSAKEEFERLNKNSNA